MEDWFTTYCVKEQRFTGCTEPNGYATASNGRTYFWCTCISCGIKKTTFVGSMENMVAPRKPKN